MRDNLNDDGTVPSKDGSAPSPDIWVRRTKDPIPELDYEAEPPHQNPVRHEDNYVYIRVKNIGKSNTTEVYFRALITHFAGIELCYPEAWLPSTIPGDPAEGELVPGTYLIGEKRIDNLASARIVL